MSYVSLWQGLSAMKKVEFFQILPSCFLLLQKLTVLVGEPIDVSGLIKSHAELSASAVVIRKQVTDVIQKKLYDLKSHAEDLHKNWTTSLPVAYRTL